MDTKAVKTFVVLSETLNYQQAAQRLSYAPSTLTGHIHALEQELRSEERRVGKECRSRWSPYH